MVKEISRRDFLRALGISGTALIIPDIVTGASKHKLPYRLKYVPDRGYDSTNIEIANKAREVAEYVLTTRDPRFLSYDDIGSLGLNAAEAVMLIDNIRYTVVATSFRDRKILDPDGMGIYVRPEDLKGDKNLVYFDDDGLDGRVNSGNLPAEHKLNPTGRHIKLVKGQKFDAKDYQVIQSLYESTLNKIIETYIKTKK